MRVHIHAHLYIHTRKHIRVCVHSIVIRYLLIHTFAHTNRDTRIQAFPPIPKTTQIETYAYRAFCGEDYDDDHYDDAGEDLCDIKDDEN